MKTLLILALVPLAMSWPSGGDGGWANPWGKQEDKEDSMDQWMEGMWKKFMEQHGGKLEFEGTLSMGGGDDDKEKDWGKAQEQKGWGDWGKAQEQKGWGDWGKEQEQRGWGKQDWGEKVEMMKMFQEFKQWAQERKLKEMMEERQRKEMMADKFEEWKRFQMMQHMKQWKEEMEDKERMKQMEALREKQMMVQKVANLTEQFKEQKMRLVHDVTSQFLEFCKCSETSAMLKKFFTESFGEMSSSSGWDMSWDDDDDLWDQQMGNMTNNRNMTGSGNNTMGNYSMGNNTMIGNSSMNYQEWAEQQKFEMAARKFYRMTQKERSMELFRGMVKNLCESANEYVQHVKKFEAFYVKYVADWQRSSGGM